jgi:hypothetical protein
MSAGLLVGPSRAFDRRDQPGEEPPEQHEAKDDEHRDDEQCRTYDNEDHGTDPFLDSDAA